MINIIGRNIMYIVIVLFVSNFLGVIDEDWFSMALGFWVLYQPVRLCIYLYQWFANQRYTLIVDSEKITVGRQVTYIENNIFELSTQRLIPRCKMLVMNPSGIVEETRLGIISKSNQAKIQTIFRRINQAQKAKVSEALESGSLKETIEPMSQTMASTPQTETYHLKQEDGIAVITIENPEALEENTTKNTPLLSWGHEPITGVLEGFKVHGVSYVNQDKTVSTILQTHTDQTVTPDMINMFDTPQGIIDVRITDHTLDFLVESDKDNALEVEAYLKTVFIHLNKLDVHYKEAPNTLPIDNQKSLIELVAYGIGLCLLLILIYVLLHSFAFLTQLGQSIFTKGSVYILNITYLIPFISPFVLLFTMQGYNKKVNFLGSLANDNQRKYVKTGSVIYMLCVILVVYFIGIIIQGGILFEVNIPITWEGFKDTVFVLKKYDLMRVYTFGFCLNIFSWFLIFSGTVLNIREKHNNTTEG